MPRLELSLFAFKNGGGGGGVVLESRVELRSVWCIGILQLEQKAKKHDEPPTVWHVNVSN